MEYFPVRSQRVLKDIIAFAGIKPSGIIEVVREESALDTWYDLQGRPVAQPGKGIYIKNGKKVVIK